MIKKCCGNDVAALISQVTYVRTGTDRNNYVSGSSRFKGRFLCGSHILALIFVDL